MRLKKQPKQHRPYKRLLALLCAFAIVMGLISPMSSFATEEGTETGLTTEEKSEKAVQKEAEEEALKRAEEEAEKAEEKSEAQSEEKAEEKSEAQSEEKAKEKSEAQSEEKAEEKSEAQSEEKAEEKSEAQSEEKAEEKPEVQSEEKAEEKPEAQSAEKAEEKPEAQSAEKAEEKPEARSEEKTEEKSEGNSENKTEQKTEKKAEKQADGKQTAKKFAPRRAPADETKVTVTFEGNVNSENKKSVEAEKNQNYIFVISADEGYKLKEGATPVAKMGETQIDVTEVDREENKYQIEADKVTGNITIEAETEVIVREIKYKVDGEKYNSSANELTIAQTSEGNPSIENDLKFKVTAKKGYNVIGVSYRVDDKTEVQLLENDKKINQEKDRELTVSKENIVGNITISITTERIIPVSYAGEHGNWTNNAETETLSGEIFSANGSFTPAAHYETPVYSYKVEYDGDKKDVVGKGETIPADELTKDAKKVTITATVTPIEYTVKYWDPFVTSEPATTKFTVESTDKDVYRASSSAQGFTFQGWAINDPTSAANQQDGLKEAMLNQVNSGKQIDLYAVYQYSTDAVTLTTSEDWQNGDVPVEAKVVGANNQFAIQYTITDGEVQNLHLNEGKGTINVHAASGQATTKTVKVTGIRVTLNGKTYAMHAPADTIAVDVKQDRAKPVVESASIVETHNVLGYIGKDKIQVTAVVSDEGSGVKTVTMQFLDKNNRSQTLELRKDGVDVESSNGVQVTAATEDGKTTYSFSLSPENYYAEGVAGTLSFELEDKVGNSGEAKPAFQKINNSKTEELVYDGTAPKAELLSENLLPVGEGDSAKQYILYNKPVKIAVKDLLPDGTGSVAGLKKVSYQVGSSEKKTVLEVQDGSVQSSCKVDISVDIPYNELTNNNGENIVTVYAEDRVGNNMTPAVYKIYKNNTSPTTEETTQAESYYKSFDGKNWVMKDQAVTFTVKLSSEPYIDPDTVSVKITDEKNNEIFSKTGVASDSNNDIFSKDGDTMIHVKVPYEKLNQGENDIVIDARSMTGVPAEQFSVTVYKDDGETNPSEATCKFDKKAGDDADGKPLFANEACIPITFIDPDSGVKEATIQVMNDTTVVWENKIDSIAPESCRNYTPDDFIINAENNSLLNTLGLHLKTTVKDNVGNETVIDPVKDGSNGLFGIDAEAPVLDSVSIERRPGNHFLNMLGFVDDQIHVTVVCSDVPSGVKELKLVTEEEGKTHSTTSIVKRSNNNGWAVKEGNTKNAEGAGYLKNVSSTVDEATGKETIVLTLKSSDILSKYDERQLTVYVVDYAGHTSVIKPEFKEGNNGNLRYDVDAPAIQATTPESKLVNAGQGNTKYQWVRKDQSLTFEVKDWNDKKETVGGAGIASIVVTNNDSTALKQGEDYTVTASGQSIKEDDWSSGANKSILVTVPYTTLVDGENTLKITAKDILYSEATERDGNTHIKTATFTYYKDTTVPKVTSIRLDGKSISHLKFSSSTNKLPNVLVNVNDNAQDRYGTSGIKSVQLEYLSKNGFSKTEPRAVLEPTNTCQEEFTYALKDEFPADGKLRVTVEDHVGNSKTYYVGDTGVSSNMKINRLVLDQTEPTCAIAPEKETYRNGQEKWYNSESPSIRFTAADRAKSIESGIATIEISLNGKPSTHNENYTQLDKENFTFDKTYKLNELGTVKQGKNVVTIKVTDNAGNVHHTEDTLYVDTISPSVVNFTINREDGAIVSREDYGFFFKTDARVTVKVEDSNAFEDRETNGSSGIDVVYFAMVDVNGTVQKVHTSNISDNKATFTVHANFKGQIYATVADKVHNTPAARNGYSEQFTDGTFNGNYVHPDGTILETPEMHRRTSGISISLPSTGYRDAEGNNLYAGNTTIPIEVYDTYSGIKSIEVKVESPNDKGNEFTNTTTVSGNGSLSDRWTVNSRDLNLVTRVSRSFTVSNNSNNIKLTVTLTDNAGNTSTEFVTLSIDKDAPVVSVSYDNNAAQSEKYFKADRTATITVVERNFNGADINCSRNGSGISFGGSVSEWRSSGPDGNGNYTYTLTHTYHDDGDYLFSMSVTDRAQYTTNDGSVSYQGTAPKDFVIDETMPVITANIANAFVNGFYLNADSSVSVNVLEHNFDPSGYSVDARFVSADDAASAFLTNGPWSGNGDNHTLVAAVTSEGTYYVNSITFTDKAGNTATIDGGDLRRFILDKTVPSIRLLRIANGGELDHTANKDEVMPQIVLDDTNFDSVTYTLTGVRNGSSISFTTPVEDLNATGGIVSFSNFLEEEVADDIYVLSVTARDKAGNTYSAEATFSVNRFGSTYMLTSETDKFVQKYWNNEEQSVSIVEINPDHLTSKGVSVSHGSNSSQLTEGTDYTVTETVPKDSSSHWYEYTYQVNAENFSGEGEYVVSLMSTDGAENSQTSELTGHSINLFSGLSTGLIYDESNATVKVNFIIDKTKPVNEVMNLDQTSYIEDEHEFSVRSTDETLLDKVVITVDGKETEYSAEDVAANNNTIKYTLDSSSSVQTVQIVAYDKAGNMSVKTNDEGNEVGVYRVLITTNLFVQWLNSTLAIALTVAGIVSLATFMIVLLKRRKKTANTAQ